MSTPPVVVLITSATCGHCHQLKAIWDTPKSPNAPSITGAMKQVRSDVKFVTIHLTNNGEKLNDTIPPGFAIYREWFPMLVLVPGPTWTEAVKNIGTTKTVDFKKGVQILNGSWTHKLEYFPKYDIREPKEFGRWLKDSLEDPVFKEVQSGKGFDSVQGESKSDRVLFDRMVKISTGLDRISLDAELGSSDVCSLRIVSRTGN